MKSIFQRTFLLAFVTLTVIYSCNEDKKQYVEAGDKMVETKLGKYKVFEHDKFKYSFIVPVDWKFQKRKKNSVIIHSIQENKDDNFIEALDIVVMEAGFKNTTNGKVKNKHSLEQLYNDQIEVLTGKDYNLKIEQEGTKKINGQISKWVNFYDNKHNRDLRIIKYYIAKDDLAYIITASTQNEKFYKYGPIFNEIIESFTLIK